MAALMPELVGHDAAMARFMRTMHEGRLHHAWLLYGMRGVGKSMLAARMAATYLCDAPTAHGPCGACHGCRIGAAGAHPDMRLVALEEGKRDISIEQVRELLAFLSLSGSESIRRVVVLQDAEQLNVQAANALLKGLEEPAPGSLLLIVCNDLMRLPATIRSRCMLEHCAPLNDTDMRRVLAGMDIDAAFSELVLHLAHGCPGRVQCLTDARIGEALLAWQRLTADIAATDLGAVQDWMGRHLDAVPHALVADIVLDHLQDQLQASLLAGGRDGYPDDVFDAAEGLARWPQAVQRHSLRPATSLFAHMMQLRRVLKAAA
jgi:DNA polymerase III delta' subunit